MLGLAISKNSFSKKFWHSTTLQPFDKQGCNAPFWKPINKVHLETRRQESHLEYAKPYNSSPTNVDLKYIANIYT